MRNVVSRHGRDRPGAGPASSTNPYLASCRKWNEQVLGGSPISSPAWVAVSCPSRFSASSSARRTGWVSARIACGSLSSRLTWSRAGARPLPRLSQDYCR